MILKHFTKNFLHISILLDRKIFRSAYISQSGDKNIESFIDPLNFERSERSSEQSPFSSDNDLPFIKTYQQTLHHSFALGGIGLHTANYTHIRLRPAPAGDGRYFVIVPKGSISESPSFVHLKQKYETCHSDYDHFDFKKINEKRYRDKSLESFLAYHDARSKGFDGYVDEFEEEYFKQENDFHVKELLEKNHLSCTSEDLEVVSRTPEEITIPATLEFARGESHFTALERNGFSVSSVEHVLASLEACGVDNCRIELEGGREVPVIDGSAYGWSTLIIRVGVVKCPTEWPKGVIKVRDPLIVTGKNDNFICVIPSDNTTLTAGWDAVAKGAPCLCRSWYTWNVNYDYHFHYSIAPAKTFYHSEFELDVLYDLGLVQAGPTTCAVVGMGEMFQDPGEVTFPDDEAARHKIIDLTGDLSLLSQKGQGGLPVGHFVSWNADHELQVLFCSELWNKFLDTGDKLLSPKPPKVQTKSKFHIVPNEAEDDNFVDDKFFTKMRKNEGIEEEALSQIMRATTTKPSVERFEGQYDISDQM